MAITPRMCRRRIRVISRSGASRSLSPVDLRIRPSHIVGNNLLRLGGFLPMEPGEGQLQQGYGQREGVGYRSEVERRTRLGELPLVQKSAVSHEQGLLSRGLQLCRETLGGADGKAG